MAALNFLLRVALFFLFFIPYVFLVMPHLPPVFIMFIIVLAAVATAIGDRIVPRG
jgi:hypothetical protein